MKHKNIWNAVDKLAEINGLSASGLAKKAGLDATTFNKSKRKRKDGRKRFPSLDSINKITNACYISFDEFISLADSDSDIKINQANSIPLIKLSDGRVHLKEEKMMIQLPDANQDIYALKIDNKSTMYEKNSTIIVNQESDIKAGDKIVIFTNEQKIHIGEFIKHDSNMIEILISSKNEEKISIENNKIIKIDKIIWVSQ